MSSQKAVLDHIGIAVADGERVKQLEKLFGILGLSKNHQEEVAEQGVMTHFIPLPPEQGNLELLEPIDSDGTVARFVAKRGPGVHHLSFRVAKGTLNPLCDQLRSEGFRLVYEEPRNGAHFMRVNFIHPSTAGGLLIELMEPQGN